MTPVIAGSINRTPTGQNRRCDMFIKAKDDAAFPLVPRLSRCGRDLFYDLSASRQAGLRIVPQAGPAVSPADKT